MDFVPNRFSNSTILFTITFNINNKVVYDLSLRFTPIKPLYTPFKTTKPKNKTDNSNQTMERRQSIPIIGTFAELGDEYSDYDDHTTPTSSHKNNLSQQLPSNHAYPPNVPQNHTIDVNYPTRPGYYNGTNVADLDNVKGYEGVGGYNSVTYYNTVNSAQNGGNNKLPVSQLGKAKILSVGSFPSRGNNDENQNINNQNNLKKKQVQFQIQSNNNSTVFSPTTNSSQDLLDPSPNYLTSPEHHSDISSNSDHPLVDYRDRFEGGDFSHQSSRNQIDEKDINKINNINNINNIDDDRIINVPSQLTSPNNIYLPHASDDTTLSFDTPYSYQPPKNDPRKGQNGESSWWGFGTKISNIKKVSQQMSQQISSNIFSHFNNFITFNNNSHSDNNTSVDSINGYPMQPSRRTRIANRSKELWKSALKNVDFEILSKTNQYFGSINSHNLKPFKTNSKKSTNNNNNTDENLDNHEYIDKDHHIGDFYVYTDEEYDDTDQNTSDTTNTKYTLPKPKSSPPKKSKSCCKCECVVIRLFKQYGWDALRVYTLLSILFSILIGIILYMTHSTYYCIALFELIPFGIGDYIKRQFENPKSSGNGHDGIDVVHTTNYKELYLLFGCISVINNILEPVRIILLLYCLNILSAKFRYCEKKSPFLSKLQYFLYLMNLRPIDSLLLLPIWDGNGDISGSGGYIGYVDAEEDDIDVEVDIMGDHNQHGNRFESKNENQNNFELDQHKPILTTSAQENIKASYSSPDLNNTKLIANISDA
jgi:hypothetical protein